MIARIIAEIAKRSGTFESDWAIIHGPDSGCGEDYWFRNEKADLEAYANVDQEYVSISIMNDDQLAEYYQFIDQ